MNRDSLLQDKYSDLTSKLCTLGSAVVAFSSGVDSSLLLHAAKDALHENVLAVTFAAPYTPEFEINDALQAVRLSNIRHLLIKLSLPEFLRNNPTERCYLCKRFLFNQLLEIAAKENIAYVLDGGNVDDLKDYRPGRKAVEELGIRSPLLEAGFSKQDIRDVSQLLGLSSWNKPAGACLLTRIPHDHVVDEAELKRVDKGEQLLKSSGFLAVRLRSHGDLVRIEVPPEEIAELCNVVREKKLTLQLKNLGYRYVTVDMDGYRMGSLNKKMDKFD